MSGTMRAGVVPFVRVAALVGLCVLLFANAGPATANGTQIGFQAGMIFPMASDSVQLVSERVVIRLRDPLTDGLVGCDYTLRNLARSSQSFRMAFSPYGYMSDTTKYRHLSFAVRARGKLLPVEFVKVVDPRWTPYVDYGGVSVPVWDLTIGPSDSLDVHMSYRAIWSGEGPWSFSYNARPAALWAGRIEHAEVIFEFDEFTATLLRCASGRVGCGDFTAKPEGSTWSGNQLRFEFTDWEPTEDVSIRVGRVGE